MSSTSRLIWVSGCRRPTAERRSRQGDVERLVRARRAPHARAPPRGAANAASSRSRTALSVIPVSRSRTFAKADLSSLLRPEPRRVRRLPARRGGARIGETPQEPCLAYSSQSTGANLAFEQLRRDSRAVRPLERQRRRGRRVLPRGSAPIRRAGRRARSRNRSHRGADRRGRHPRDRCRLVARDARRLRAARGTRRRRGRPARRRPSRATGHGARAARDLSVPLAPAHAHRRGPAQRPRLLRTSSSLPGGRFVFDVFSAGRGRIARRTTAGSSASPESSSVPSGTSRRGR